jgi:hypothetical protein
MANDELDVVIRRLIGMVSSLELATSSVLELLVQNAVMDRDVLLKGLIEHRERLDQNIRKGRSI